MQEARHRARLEVQRGRFIVAVGNAEDIEDKCERHTDEQIHYQGGDGSVDGKGDTPKMEDIDRRLEVLDDHHPGADDQSSQQTNDKGATMEPVCIEANKHGGKDLDDPDITEQLKIDDQGCWQEDDKNERAYFHQQRGGFRRP